MGVFARRMHNRAPRRVLVGTLALLVPVLSAGVLPIGTVAAAAFHRATLPGVTLLRPVGTARRPPTNFDAGANLRIEIFGLESDMAVGEPVGPSFATTPAGPDQRIRVIGVDGGRGKYRADWNTTASGQPAGSLLRIEIRMADAPDGPACNDGVGLDSGCVGYFDVGLFKRHHRVPLPDSVRPVALGKTLPIRFHVAHGALTPTAEGATQLSGDPDASAADAIPNLHLEFNLSDYAPNPVLGGMMVSFDTLFLIFNLNATVADANAVLTTIQGRIIGGVPGGVGHSPGILWVRVPAHSHAEMDALIAQLRADSRVRVAVQDTLLEPLEEPAPVAVPADWTWEVDPSGGNWGMEAIRAPQLWSLNDAVKKSHRSVAIGVLDTGFISHPDLTYGLNLAPGSATAASADHGTHVAGTIAATYNNSMGVDGVNPSTELAVEQVNRKAGGWGVFDFMDEVPGLKIINLSLGENWYKWTPALDPALSSYAQDLVSNEGAVFQIWEALRLFHGQNLPLIVAAAGNDSNKSSLNFVDVDAKWNSPWNYAALALGVDNVLVVESIGQDGEGGYVKAASSNINGQISAPGVGICSTAPVPVNPADACDLGSANAPYQLKSGTSMATPHVTGIAGYLLNLDPTLTSVQLRNLLTSTSHPVSSQVSDRVDAFAAALAIDALRGNQNVAKMLVDIDDGTADGDLRVKCTPACGEFTDEDADGDGGAGDGVIDMSDFRRWRDWLLITEDSPSLAMDGEDTNLKFDVNHNGIPEVGEDENIYPDGDFNGDGVIDDTDLPPLQALFDDFDYSASDLHDLIYSSDIHVDPTACMTPGGRVRATIYDAGTMDWLDERDLSPSDDNVLTVPVAPNGYLVSVIAKDSDGNVAGVAQKKFASELGGDVWFAPECGRVTLTPPQVNVVLDAGDSTTPSVSLKSEGLDTDWTFTSTVEHVEPAVTGGSLAADGEVALDPTITCPETAGGYGGFLDLEFRDADGNVIEKGVPEYLTVDIVCLAGGVEADPSPLSQTLSAGTSTQREITLKNNGTALEYEAQAGDHVAIDDGASGELAKLGQAVIKVTLTCPLTPGSYSSTVALTFTRADGKPVTVAHPESVPVDLECTGLLKLNGLVVENSIEFENLDKKWEQYWSRDDEGTAEHNLRTTVNNTATYQHEVIDPIGWGDVSSSLAFSRTVPPPPPGYEWMAPFQRAGTMSGNGSVDYSSSYDGTTATWGADFAFDYGTTRPPPNPDIGQEVCGTYSTQCSSLGATVTTYFEVLPNTQQHLLITWTCGIFESPTVPVGTNGAGGLIYINEIGPGGSTVFYSDSAQGCGYETVFGPGKYGLTAAMYLVSGASTSAGPVSGSFTVTATYVPPDEP